MLHKVQNKNWAPRHVVLKGDEMLLYEVDAQKKPIMSDRQEVRARRKQNKRLHLLCSAKRINEREDEETSS